MNTIDSNHNNRINYTEFLASVAGDHLFTEEGIRKAFRILDRDGNGQVERRELLELFRGSDGVKQNMGSQVAGVGTWRPLWKSVTRTGTA